MRFPPLLLLITGLVALASPRSGNAAPPPADLLHDLSGWRLVTEPAAELSAICVQKPEGVLAVAGKPIGYLTTTTSFENFALHVEWRWPGTPGNGGVLVHIATGPKDRQWPECFQMQLKHTRAGDILPMAGATFAELPTPDAKQLDRQSDSSEKPAGEWNACDLVCRGDTIECRVNGVVQNRITRCRPAAGTIGFQLEGVAYELRNVRVTPLAP